MAVEKNRQSGGFIRSNRLYQLHGFQSSTRLHGLPELDQTGKRSCGLRTILNLFASSGILVSVKLAKILDSKYCPSPRTRPIFNGV